jgi:hypothetical protein
MSFTTDDYKDQAHLNELKNNYERVGNEAWKQDDLISSRIQASRNLFTEASLEARNPVPKNLEVYALLSGISFSKGFLETMSKIQSDLKEILGDKLHYLVPAENLGVEHCVYKWPDANWNEEWEDEIVSGLTEMSIDAFNYHIFGIQLNSDGCLVLRGYDEGRSIFKLRKKLKELFQFYPERQSNWAHVPLGRILEPVGEDIYRALKEYIDKHSFEHLSTEKISSLKFVHETQWYMAKKTILKEFSLEPS